MSTDYLSTGRQPYHWRRQGELFYRRRRLAAELSPANTPSSVEPTLAIMADAEHLLAVYRELRVTGGPAPGIDGLTFGDISTTEMAAALRRVALAIRDRRYRPYPTRRVWARKPNGGFRELRIGTLCDRVVAAALYRLLRPVVDRHLLPGCFGFRPGKSVLHLLATLEQLLITEGRYVIATDDVLGAFDHVRLDHAVAVHRLIVADDGLMWLTETVLMGSEGQSRTVGIDQGSAISPQTLLLVLTDCLDRPLSADPANPPLLWWADNLTHACRSVSEGRQTLQRDAELLATAGFQLKGEDGAPTDLRRQGAHKLILGYEVSLGDGRLHLGIPNKAWLKLHRELSEAQGQPNPNGTAQVVMRGWLEAYGPALGGADLDGQVDRALRMAAMTGFRELGPTEEWTTYAADAYQRWERIRQSIQRPQSA